MSSLKRLIAEIHRRSLWQVLGIYLAGSWVALQVVREVTLTLNLPSWVPPFAFVLLVIGLPVVLATAFVQEGGPLSEEWDGEGADARPAGDGGGPSRAASGTDGGRGGRTLKGLFTWRNALAGGVLAFALLGLAVTGWFLYRTDLGSRPLLETAATGPPAAASAADSGVGEATDTAVRPMPAGTASEAGTPPADPTPAGTPPTEAAGPTEETADADRDRPAAAGAGDGRARSDYREARDAAEEALRSAVEAGARRVGEDLLAAGDSLAGVAVAAAEEGRYEEAGVTMGRARAAYEEAGDAAREIWLARLDSVKEEVRSLLARRELDSTTVAYARAEELRRQAARLEEFGRYPEAVDSLLRTVAAFERVPAGEDDSLPAAYQPSPREVVEATVKRIARAIEAEDLEALRAVWTSLTAEQAAGFRQFFDQARDLSVGYSVREESIVVGEDRVVATVETVWHYFDEAARSRKEQRDRHRFEFSLQDGVWVVTGS